MRFQISEEFQTIKFTNKLKKKPQNFHGYHIEKKRWVYVIIMYMILFLPKCVFSDCVNLAIQL